MDYLTFVPLAPTAAEQSHLYDELEKAIKALAAARYRYSTRAEATRNFTVPVEHVYSAQTNAYKIPPSAKAALRTLHKRQCASIVAIDKAEAHVDHIDRLVDDLHARERAWGSWCALWQQEQLDVMHLHMPTPMNVPMQMRMPAFVQQPLGYCPGFTGRSLEDMNFGERLTLSGNLDQQWRTHTEFIGRTAGQASILPHCPNHGHSDAASYAEVLDIDRTDSGFDESSSFIDEWILQARHSGSNDGPLDVTRHVFSHELLHYVPKSTGCSQGVPYRDLRSGQTGQEYAGAVEPTDMKKAVNTTGNLERLDRCKRMREDGLRKGETQDANVHKRLAQLNEIPRFRLRRSYSLSAEQWVR